MITVFGNFTCSQLCNEIDEREKNSQDMIEEEKKKITGAGNNAFSKSFNLCALVSGSSGPCSSPGRGHCVVFLGKTLYSHSASLHPGV